MKEKLFSVDLPELKWVEFSADGFSEPVAGVIYRSDRPAVCGLPLGGIDTGCIDLETDGTLGYSTIFNSHVPRLGPLNLPFLGVSVGKQTWVLTTRKMDGVHTAKEIHYWGHYPVADLEYETDAPVSIGLRAWAPFIPGDTAISNTPGAVLEFHLRNTSDSPQQGSVALSFPGPSPQEAEGATAYPRESVEGVFSGVTVTNGNDIGYALGVVGKEKLRCGGFLGADGGAWSRIASELPEAVNQRGAAVAVDFELQPNETKRVRFILAWYSPKWTEGGTPTAEGNTYTHMYVSRYKNALEVAQLLAEEHQSLLRRTLAWQQVIYTDETLPVWLRDSLVNILHLIPEDSFWAMAKPPIEDWCHPKDGLFGLMESPRSCPQIECIPCSFYGNIPIVYFFPELALSTLRGYKQYMRADGAAPFIIGPKADMATPSHEWQKTLNGPCYVDMVNRYWLRTGDDEMLREFYPSVKKNTTFTMNLRPEYGPDGVISMPTGNAGAEWFESCKWYGMTAHVGGVHLANLRMAERMAEKMGDEDFAQQCRDWFNQGSNSMESKMWAGEYYLNYYEPETGKKSDVVLAYQMDGEWMVEFHGLHGVFKRDRVKTTLATVKRTCVPLTQYGAVSFARPDGTTAQGAGYDFYGLYSSQILMLAMNYMYEGERDFGLELAHRIMHNMIIRLRLGWNMPVHMHGDTGEVTFGTDYYQNLMLWSLPAALEGKDLTAPCASGGLVDRVIQAGKK